MDVFIYNFVWMGENVGLALLGILFCFLFLRAKRILFKTIFFIFWVLFVPNTIYLITDIQYLPEQFLEADVLLKIILIMQYLTVILLGVVSYIASVYPIGLFLSKVKESRQYIPVLIFLFNFLIAFAIALGKVQRTHSWHIFSEPIRVINDFYYIASSNEVMLFVIVFGLVLNILYFFIIRSFQAELKKIFA